MGCVWPKPGILFIFQVITYWFLWCAVSIYASKTWKYQLLILSAACLPPFWSQSVMLWKDTEFSLAILGSFLFAETSTLDIVPSGTNMSDGYQSPQNLRIYAFIGRWVPLLLSLLLFFFAAAVRKNAVTALLPLAFFLISKIQRKSLWHQILPYALALVGFSFLFTNAINYDWLKASRGHSFQTTEALDITGVFVQTHDPRIIPAYWYELNKDLNAEMILRNYDPASVNNLFFLGERPLRFTTDPRLLAELDSAWLCAIRNHPREYLLHRWSSFSILMGFGQNKIRYPFFLKIVPNPYGFYFKGDAQLRGALTNYFTFFGNSVLFRGWVYLCILSWILFYQARKLSLNLFLKNPSVCSALSAFLYTIGFFIVAPNSDSRYLYLTFSLTCLSIIFTLKKDSEKNLYKRPLHAS